MCMLMWDQFNLPVIASEAKQSSLKKKQFFDEVCQLNWRLLRRHFVAPRNDIYLRFILLW